MLPGVDESKSGSLFFVNKLRWKSMRSIMNPTFSQMKLRSLTPLINLCVSRLMNQIEKLNEKEVPVAGYIYLFYKCVKISLTKLLFIFRIFKVRFFLVFLNFSKL